MKIKFFCINLILFTYLIYANPNYFKKKYMNTDEYAFICISDNKIEFNNRVENGVLVHYYGIDSFKGNNNDYVILNVIVSETEFLYLIKDLQEEGHNYGSWEMTYIDYISECPYTSAKLVPFKVKKASSFIIEKDKNGNDIRYLPENSNLFFLGSNPWAVSKDSGATIELSTERWRNDKQNYYPIYDIVVVNGFVYPGKEYLYEQNSRAKRVQISYNDISFTTELQDTGNFQVVHLPTPINPTKDNNIKIEIIDSYQGSKYSDIVISGVYYMDALFEKSK